LTVLGSFGVATLGGGYILFVFLKVFYLDYLEQKHIDASSAGFRTYRLVYFGNKELRNL